MLDSHPGYSGKMYFPHNLLRRKSHIYIYNSEGIKGSTDIAPISHKGFLQPQIPCKKYTIWFKDPCKKAILKAKFKVSKK